MSIPKKKFAEINKKHQMDETKSRIDDIGAFVSCGDTILDVGCGNGQFGEAVARHYNATVHGVDVVDYGNASIPIAVYDGVRLPFKDDSFDVIVMAMMLHHVENQEELLMEAIRCSRRGLVIYKDTYFSPWQKIAIIWNDFYSNRVIGLVKIFKGLKSKGILAMPLPFKFRSVDKWYQLFSEKLLINCKIIVRHMGLKPHSKATFILEKNSSHKTC